jgi:hypothetical protein
MGPPVVAWAVGGSNILFDALFFSRVKPLGALAGCGI